MFSNIASIAGGLFERSWISATTPDGAPATKQRISDSAGNLVAWLRAPWDFALSLDVIGAIMPLGCVAAVETAAASSPIFSRKI